MALTGKRMPYGLARQLHRIFSEAPELPSCPAYNGFPQDLPSSRNPLV